VRPDVWRPPVEPSAAERGVIKAVRRAKLFVFLREHRHELFDQQFQAELAEAYADRPKGQPPVPPAQLALATILQAYAGVSDDEVIEAAVMDRRCRLRRGQHRTGTWPGLGPSAEVVRVKMRASSPSARRLTSPATKGQRS
jgi:hypothetical protein